MEADPSLRSTQTPVDTTQMDQIDESSRFERLRHAFETPQLAWHSLRSRIADRRMKYSGGRMETMDHKDALYYDLGTTALTGSRSKSPTATGKPAMPRTWAERLMDSRLDSQGQKKSRADIYVYGETKIFGDDNTEPGLSPREKAKARKQLVNDQLQGNITAADARRKSVGIGAEPVKWGAEGRRIANKAQKKASRKTDRKLEQPILSRWRDSRAEESIKDIKRHHARGEKHRAKRQAILERRQGRAAAHRPGNSGNINQNSRPSTRQSASTQLFDQDDL